MSDLITRKRAIVIIAICVSSQLGAYVGRNDTEAKWRERVPTCQEDEILIGSGDFAHGRWGQYQCAHDGL